MNIETSLIFMKIKPDSIEEIKFRYKELAKEYHPDISGGDEDLFKTLQSHYEYLMNNFKPPKKKPKKKFPDNSNFGGTIYRVLDERKSNHIITIPRDLLSDGDVVMYLMWGAEEYRTLVKQSTDLSKKYKISKVEIEFKLEDVY